MTILKTTARETSCNRCVALSLGFVKDGLLIIVLATLERYARR